MEPDIPLRQGTPYAASLRGTSSISRSGRFRRLAPKWPGRANHCRNRRARTDHWRIHQFRLRQLLADLKLFEPRAEATTDIWAFLWGKLAYGPLLFAQPLGQDGIADCLERPELLPLWRKMVAEVLAVAEAEGVAPSGFNGFMPDAFAPAKGTLEASKKSVEKMAAFNRPNAKTHSGIWRDLAVRKRKTEVDAFIGKIMAIGKIHQIQCPVLENLVEMIHEIENGRRIQSNANLTELWRKNAN